MSCNTQSHFLFSVKYEVHFAMEYSAHANDIYYIRFIRHYSIYRYIYRTDCSLSSGQIKMCDMFHFQDL